MQTKPKAVGRLARQKWFAHGPVLFDCGLLMREIGHEERGLEVRPRDEFAGADLATSLPERLSL